MGMGESQIETPKWCILERITDDTNELESIEQMEWTHVARDDAWGGTSVGRACHDYPAVVHYVS